MSARICECGRVKCCFSCFDQPPNQRFAISACLKEMICNFSGVLVNCSGIEPLDRSGHVGVKLLPSHNRGLCEDRLTHQLMSETEGFLRPLGTRNDYPHPL